MPEDFIETYCDFTRHQASPTVFHRWAAVAVLGAALERRVWLTRGYEKLRVYPGQLMVVLVGDSALQKKTTACDFATDLLYGLQPWQLQILPKKTSPNRLAKLLERQTDEGMPITYPEGHVRVGKRVNSSGFINAGELAVFFSTDNYNEMLAATINELNDAKSGKHRIEFNAYQVDLWNPLVGMLGAITPKGIAQELPKAARTAGFFGRILWVHASGGSRPNSLTKRIPEERETKERLREGVSNLANMYGPYTFTKQGEAYFDSWFYDEYTPHLERLDAYNMLDTTGYWGRKDSHVLRVAMVCSASRSWGQDRFLKQADLARAVTWLADIEKGFPEAMASIGVGPYTEENTRVVQYIESRSERYAEGWVPKKDIASFANRLGLRGQAIEDCLLRLRDAETLERDFKGGIPHYRRRYSQGDLIRRAVEEKTLQDDDEEERPPTLRLVKKS